MTRRFWEEGIRFECQGTGKCCTSRDSYGYVYLTLEDRRRLSKHLGISTSAFTRRYCNKTNGYFHLKYPQEPCQFLQDKSCTIYEARPVQCRTWPFWPENMNARTWNREVKAFCPGIGKGRLFSKEEIQELLKRDPIT
jgi:Fe-S-cluster containining protein